MTGSTPISTGAAVPGANPVSQAQTQTPVAQKSESTWTIWKNSFFGKDAGFFKRTVCTIAAAVSYLPARAYSYFTGKGLLARTVTQPQAPVQNQMPAANGQAPAQNQAPVANGQAPAQPQTAPASVSQTPASPVSSEVESLKAQLALMAEGDKNKLVRIQHLVEAQKKEQQEKAQVEAQLAATVEGEKNKQARIEHLVEEQKHKLESQKSQFMAQLKDKDRLIQRLDEIQVKERAELEKIKAKCAEHEKSEEVAKGTLSKYVKECAGNDRKIGELNAKVSELTKDCNNLMLRNPETKEVVDRLKKDHEVAIARLVAELQAERDGSGRQIEELRARVSELTNECQNLMLRDLENKSLVDRLKKDHDEAIAHLVTELQAARDGSERLSPTQTNTVGVQTADINHALLEEERVDSYTPAQTYTLGMQAGDIYDTSLHSVDGRPLPDPIRPASISPAPSDPRAELERVLEEAVHFVHRRVGAPVIPQPVIPQDNSPSVTTSLLTGFDPLMQAEEHIPFASDVSTYAWRNNPAYDNGNLLVSVEGGEDTESVS